MAQARFDRETTLITGAGSGVGAATVRRYAAMPRMAEGMGVPGGAETIEMEVWRKMLAVNLDAALLAVRAALPAMRANAGGFIVLDSSIGGCWAVPGGCPMRP